MKILFQIHLVLQISNLTIFNQQETPNYKVQKSLDFWTFFLYLKQSENQSNLTNFFTYKKH